MRTLEPKDMTERPMAARIARRLKQFHAVVVDGSQEPQAFNSIKKWCALSLVHYFSPAPQLSACTVILPSSPSLCAVAVLLTGSCWSQPTSLLSRHCRCCCLATLPARMPHACCTCWQPSLGRMAMLQDCHGSPAGLFI